MENPNAEDRRLDHDEAEAIAYETKDLRTEAAASRAIARVLQNAVDSKKQGEADSASGNYVPTDFSEPPKLFTELEEVRNTYSDAGAVPPDDGRMSDKYDLPYAIKSAKELLHGSEEERVSEISYLASDAEERDQEAEELDEIALWLHRNPPSADFLKDHNDGEILTPYIVARWKRIIESVDRFKEKVSSGIIARDLETAIDNYITLRATMGYANLDDHNDRKSVDMEVLPTSMPDVIMKCAKNTASEIDWSISSVYGGEYQPTALKLMELEDQGTTTLADLRKFATEPDLTELMATKLVLEGRIDSIKDGSATDYKSNK